MIKIPSLSLFFILGVAFLSMGTVLKKKDPVAETQTGSIGYSEKAKEGAEGKKGPPMPTLELYPKERFLTEGPVEKGKSSPVAEEETGEEFKLGAERDDTKKKPAKAKPRFLDTTGR